MAAPSNDVSPSTQDVQSNSPPKEFFPVEYYTKFLSDSSKARRPSPIRGLYHLETVPNMISFLAGKPAPQTFPVTSLSLTVRSPSDPTKEDLLQIKGERLAEALQYTSTRGIPSFSKWVTGLQERYHGRYAQREGWTSTVGGGSQDLLYKAFHALLNPGDAVLIEAPAYAGVLPIFESLHAKLIDVETDSEGISGSSLRTILEAWPPTTPYPKILYTVPFGCNPSGMTASLSRRAEVLALAREYNFLIIEDDPYFYLYYGTQPQPSSYFALEAQDGKPVGQVLRFDSLSKVLSAGLRIGFASGPSVLIDAIDKHTASANLQTSSTTQALAVAMLEHFGYDGFQKHAESISQYYKQKRDIFEQSMQQHLDGLAEWTTPEAGMFVWFKLNLPRTELLESDSEVLIRTKAMERGVLALPGAAFYPNGRTTAYVRASFSLVTAEEIDEGLRRLALVIKEYRG